MDEDYDDPGFFGQPRAYKPMPGGRSVAQWRAVLSALPSGEPGPVALRMTALRREWRLRLARLHRAGWEPLQRSRFFQQARNCPPFACEYIKGSFPCGLRICPFCWAREVVGPLYDRLCELLLPRPGENREAPDEAQHRPGVTGIAYRETIREPQGSFFPLRPWHGELAEVFDSYRLNGTTGEMRNFTGRRRDRRVGIVGGWLHLAMSRTEDDAVLHRRGIVLCDRPTRFLRDGTSKIDMFLEEPRTKRDVSQLVGRVARYHGWWLRGDVDQVLQLLRDLGRTRTVATYGLLRGSQGPDEG